MQQPELNIFQFFMIIRQMLLSSKKVRFDIELQKFGPFRRRHFTGNIFLQKLQTNKMATGSK